MNSLIDFEIKVPENFSMPADVIEEQCSIIRSQTKSMVLARVVEFRPEVVRTPHEGWFTFQGNNTPFTYEFFITSKHTPNYKFRVLFLENPMVGYPVLLHIEPGIAEELKMDYQKPCKNEAEFLEILKSILNSEKLQRVVNSLYAKSLKEEAMADADLPF